MTDEQFVALRQTLADIQTSVDSVDLKLERLADQELQVPDWVGSGASARVWDEIQGQLHWQEYLAEEQNAGVRVVGRVVISTMIIALVIIGVLAAYLAS